MTFNVLDGFLWKCTGGNAASVAVNVTPLFSHSVRSAASGIERAPNPIGQTFEVHPRCCSRDTKEKLRSA
jgi:hypothetical protein